MSETKPCLYGLHSYCIVEKRLRDNGKDTSNWGSIDWIKLNCSLCIKSMYAKAKIRMVSKFSVVNTL